ncbi:dTMP kinase [Rhodocaloribacter litoris]|uniref:dTMP kinase n=1 Tax=Rhodocaloribacter litoris TaxID=2558931 RepID=UPI001423E85C|nr:dTMP kinase [Rhodocaloribacter litoris]QXD13901.1 dTMP kinase [Rhodocaloribacter litoris]
MLVSFEGIDGSGKSTQARLLAARLEAAGIPVLLVREPGGTALSERVRALLLDPALHIVPFAELLLFSAARAQLVAERIRPALEAGQVVLCDRFYDSSTAYQGGGHRVESLAWLRDFHARVTGGLRPDRTYLLDVPPAVARRRRSDRGTDRMEAAGEAFFERVATTYARLAEDEPERFLHLDGTRPPEAVHAQIWADLLPRLADRRGTPVSGSGSPG